MRCLCMWTTRLRQSSSTRLAHWAPERLLTMLESQHVDSFMLHLRLHAHLLAVQKQAIERHISCTSCQ
ncbi:hypothetical protein WJX74_003737 [Apatococcus lobatus]|uniref:Uncharacterized protein n=1 Tax=Apatococcus lobatus TaxID=904363 RepID=A0AAW1R0V5_9CHLO